jgi:hypothetical protein
MEYNVRARGERGAPRIEERRAWVKAETVRLLTLGMNFGQVVEELSATRHPGLGVRMHVVEAAGKGNIGDYRHQRCAASAARELDGGDPFYYDWRDCKTCAPGYAD